MEKLDVSLGRLTAGGDPWRISVEERAKHDSQFLSLSPQAGYITGEQAKKFFMQSGLPTPILSQIWSLANMNADGKMDRKEFSIAMCLISKKLHGFELPQALPPSLKQDPVPQGMGTMSGMPGAMQMGGVMMGPQMGGVMMGGQPRPAMQMGRGFSLGPQMPMTSQRSVTSPMPMTSPLMSSTSLTRPVSTGGFVSPATPMSGFGSAQSMHSMPSYSSPHKMPASTGASGDWAVPHGSKLKYTQLFNMEDRTKKGFLSSMEARAILTRSGLTHNVLAQVWTLSDIDSDGKLTCDEFVLAMHLIDLVKQGQALPSKLTPELIPPSYRKGQKSSHAVGLPPGGLPGIGSASSIQSMPAAPPAQKDQFGDLLTSTGFNMTGPLPPTPAAAPGNVELEPEPGSILSQVTFEDKRKENFDKGQAELERRRQLLLDQQKQMEEARLAKEREEAEKRERKRQEMERKKQMELERQMEKQRQIEQAREEERRKALEQREAARRELERQRQMEWERQRRDQLMAEKQREQALVDQSQAEVAKLKLELEALDNKKTDMFAQIEEARSSVTNVTSQIDRMRTSRDLKLSEIDRLQSDVQEWRNKLLVEQQQRQQLDIKCQAENNTVDDTYKTVLHSVNNKKHNIETLRQQLKQIEEETAKHLASIDQQNTDFKKLQQKVDSLQEANNQLSSDVTSKQTVWNQSKTAQNDSFAAFDSLGGAFNTAAPSSGGRGTTSSTPVAMDNLNADHHSNTRSKSADIWSSAFADLSEKKPKAGGSVGQDAWSNAFFSNASDLFSDKGASSVQWGTANQTPAASSNSDWANAFAPQNSAPSGGDGCPGPGYRKFRGLFQFQARNVDELSFDVGDIVWVKPDQSEAEEGWLGGTFGGKEGWFPAAYAEEVSDDQSTASTAVTSAVPENKPDENKFEANFDAFGQSGASGNTLAASADSSFTAVTQNAPSPTPGQGEAAPAGLQATALYTWRAKKDNHLTFEKGDVITVTEQQDMWWSGTLHGKSGWFPKSYVKVIGGASTPVQLQPASDPAQGADDPSLYQNTDFSAEPANTYQNTADFGNIPSQIPTQSGGERAVAMYTYNSAESGDLTFTVGDVIHVISKEDDWWTGRIGDRTGIFPANYVKLEEGNIQNQSESATQSASQSASQSATQSASHTPIQSPTQTEAASHVGSQEGGEGKSTLTSPTADTHTQPLKSPTGSLPRNPSQKGSKREIAQVIAPYQATGPEQLSLQPNQLIQVRKKSPSGWWEGELQARGQKRKVGWFPANYVKSLGGSARSPPAENILAASPQPGDGSRSATPVSLPAPAIAPSLEQVVALYNYAAQHEDEMTFAKGSVINVLEKSDPDWWKGELNGQSGMFPANYVAPLAEAFQGQETKPES